MSIFDTYEISTPALFMILAILILSGVTRMAAKTEKSKGWVAVSMIFLGLVFSTASEWLGYACYGVGLVVALVDFFRGRKAAQSEDG